jgi:hypothetical protein
MKKSLLVSSLAALSPFLPVSQTTYAGSSTCTSVHLGPDGKAYCGPGPRADSEQLKPAYVPAAQPADEAPASSIDRELLNLGS